MHEVKDGGLKQCFILNTYLSISCIIDIQEIFVEQVNKSGWKNIFNGWKAGGMNQEIGIDIYKPPILCIK